MRSLLEVDADDVLDKESAVEAGGQVDVCVAFLAHFFSHFVHHG
ncbi:MAG TPA: hypothetical protein VJ742_12510 [Nitrososphaera sp.]|nr:hypothetical protein [Nitrososphaera sp.]